MPAGLHYMQLARPLLVSSVAFGAGLLVLQPKFAFLQQAQEPPAPPRAAPLVKPSPPLPQLLPPPPEPPPPEPWQPDWFERFRSAAACCRFDDTGDLLLSRTVNVSFTTPAACEPLCLARRKCMFFSHSVKRFDCYLCQNCRPDQLGSSRTYTSWRRRQPHGHPRKAPLHQQPPKHLPPAKAPCRALPCRAFNLFHDSAACCRRKKAGSMQLAYVRNRSYTKPASCASLCLSRSGCNSFSHSVQWRDCFLCGACRSVEIKLGPPIESPRAEPQA